MWPAYWKNLAINEKIYLLNIIRLILEESHATYNISSIANLELFFANDKYLK